MNLHQGVLVLVLMAQNEQHCCFTVVVQNATWMARRCPNTALLGTPGYGCVSPAFRYPVLEAHDGAPQSFAFGFMHSHRINKIQIESGLQTTRCPFGTDVDNGQCQ